MAGIKEAMQRVMDRRNKGKVVAKGKLKEYSDDKNNDISYIIVQLAEDPCKGNHYGKIKSMSGLITVYDCGSDVVIDGNIQVGDNVTLMIRSNWNAAWIKDGIEADIEA